MKKVKNDWKLEEVQKLFNMPFNELLFEAHESHIKNHKKDTVQVCTLLSIKTGGCPEDCGYCSQSIHSDEPMEATPLMSLEEVEKQAKIARDQGSTRFCMGAAWRRPSNKNIDRVIKMIDIVHDLGMESCVTLGMLSEDQAQRLAKSGLNYYNHNLDTSREHYAKVISTRNYQDRLNTLKYVRSSGIKVCSGGILGLGESQEDRAKLLIELANLEEHPESVPINMLVQIEGTRLYDNEKVDEFVKEVADMQIDSIGSNADIGNVSKKNTFVISVELKEAEKIEYTFAKLNGEEDYLMNTSSRPESFRLPPLASQKLLELSRPNSLVKKAD